MGSDCRIVIFGDDSERLMRASMARLTELERRWSRFLPDSEVSQLNRAGSRPTIVSPDTYLLVDRAVFAAHGTRGWFDPTMLRELRTAGYDRSHEDLRLASGRPDDFPAPGDGSGAPRPPAIELDPTLWSITLPPGVEFDPGGIGKGLGADLVTDLLLEGEATRTLVDLGGDIRVTDMNGEPWPIEVDDPFEPGRAFKTLALANAGVATSSRIRRRWIAESGATHHHLLDPRTRQPSTTDLAAVTCAAGETWWAEVLAKAALLAGPEQGAQLVASNQGAAALFDQHGQLHDTGGFLALEARASSPIDQSTDRTEH